MANTRASLFVFLPACTLMLVQTLVRLSTARPVMSVTGQLRRSLAILIWFPMISIVFSVMGRSRTVFFGIPSPPYYLEI